MASTIIKSVSGSELWSGEAESLSNAVQAAVKAGADLRWADLRWANLRWADLRWADLRWANLRWADLSGANLRWADLRWADLSGANGLPADRDLLQRVCEAALKPDALNMANWHTCDTTHCLAGWAIHLSGQAGYALERMVGPSTAGALLIPEASHLFTESNEAATKWCREKLDELAGAAT